MYVHVVFFREFHRTDLQDLGAQAGQFEHLVVGDLFHLARFLANVRIGGVDAVNICIDLANIGFKGSCECNGRGVGAAATKGGYVAGGIDALKTGHDNDRTRLSSRRGYSCRRCFQCAPWWPCHR